MQIRGLERNRGEVLADHFLLFLLPVALHVMLFLATQWSVEVRCRVRFNRQPSIDKATHVKVVPLPREGHANDTRVALVRLIQEEGQMSISYLKKKFVYNSTTGKFERLHFEITSPLEFYLGSTGLTAKEVDERKRKYGENIYDIPLPDFWELFQELRSKYKARKEHAVAPFFVFQLFCVLLWLMDEYWYYSLLTLFLLVVLEDGALECPAWAVESAQMVHRRRHDLSELRSMRIPPMPTLAFRDGQWQEIQSNQLLPGDIIGIQRNPEASFPCDALLLQGIVAECWCAGAWCDTCNVLVNEAMLTGESVPQMKVHAAASACSSGQVLDMLGRHKQHIVSAGTNIMMHQNSENLGLTAPCPQPPTPNTLGALLADTCSRLALKLERQESMEEGPSHAHVTPCGRLRLKDWLRHDPGEAVPDDPLQLAQPPEGVK
eukprot:s574_g16.t1